MDAGTWSAEARTVALIMSHLVNKDGVLVLVEQPEQDPGETDEAYRTRQMRDRVLAVSPNYEEA